MVGLFLKASNVYLKNNKAIKQAQPSKIKRNKRPTCYKNDKKEIPTMKELIESASINLMEKNGER